ncbi:MAG: DUF998 domain-containing protein [Candidatus Aenigmatarchaeota archaeon]|nr:MAG: DUF998 domain-containing protein [Candidatus Aenigmarchaeota archaeon]
MNPIHTGIIGILAAVIPLVAIFTAISISPWFTWTDSWLSDLGGSTRASAPIMNSGLMIGALAGIIFAYGLWKNRIFRGDEGEFGLSTLFLSSFFLFFVGFLPVDFGMPHTLASFLFFLFSILTLIILGKVILRSGNRNYGYFVLFLGTISAASFPFFFVARPWGTNAVIEMITTTSMSLFVLITGIKMIRKEGFTK